MMKHKYYWKWYVMGLKMGKGVRYQRKVLL